MLKYAGDELTHVLFAGTYNQTRDCRYNGGIHGAVANVMKCMPEKHVKFAEELARGRFLTEEGAAPSSFRE